MHLDPSIIRVKEIKYKSFEEDATEVDKTSDGTSKIINAGEYTIKLEIIDKTIYKWLDKTTDDKSFKITVDRAKPNVTAAFKNTLPTNLYVSYNDGKLPELKNSATNATAGKIDWQADQSPRTDDTTFYWEFTPDDTVNYLKITGMSDETKITVPYKTQAIDKLEIILHKDGEEEDAEDVKIYDAFTLTDGSYSLKNYITVNAVYQDGITKEALGSSGYVLSIVGGAPKLSAGNLTIRAKQASGTKYGDLAITVLASEVVDIDPTYDDNGTALTYPVTIDDIKDNLKVIAKWNYSDNDYLDVDIDDVTVTGNLVAGAVGDVELTVSYGGKTAKIYPQIDKGTLDMSGVSLTTSTTGVTGSNGAYTCTYDPAVTVVFATSGDVKNADGDTVTATSTVTYKKKNSSGAWIVATAADLQNAGEYQIIAKYVPDDTANYKIATGEDEITVTLTINKAKVTGIVFEDAVKPEITGTSYTLEATGYPEEWVTVTYSVTDEENNPLSGTSFSAAGKYKFTATFTIDAAHVNNYEAIAPITKTLTISDKPPVTGAENIVVEPTISATYTGKPVDYKAQNVPEGVEVSYKIEKKDDVAFSGTDIINVGEYTVTVSFETGAAYAPIADKTCVVTVGKAKVDMSGVKFADDTVTGNGQAHKFEATNLPEGVTVEYEYKGNKQADPFEFTEVGEYTVKAYFTYEDEDNYEEIKPVEATLTISDAVVESISANVEDGAKFDINGTLDDVKAKIKAEIHFNNGTKQSVGIEDLTIDCATLREGGLLEVGTQTITVVYNDGTQDYTTTVQIEVAKAKVALPVYNGSLRYTGFDVKPAASDFEGFDSALMALVDSKTVAGLNAGAYKAVFALKDAERYEWATARTYKKSVFAAVVYEEVVLEDYEAAVDWNLARAKITATKANGKLPVFASESYTGSFAEVVGLKYYTDETCAEEVAADELAYSTKYFVKAELLDTANFELDETAVAFSRNAFEYTTPEKQLTVWEKVVKFLTINWLWIVIAVVALILLITVIALIARAAKRKREREEQRRLEEKEEKKREQEEREERRREEREERMARLNQQQMMMPQMMPMGGQMPQMPMQQSVPMPQQAQAQPVAAVGSASELAEIKAEISALRAEQNLRDVSALKAEQQVTQTKIDLQFANLFSRLGVEQGVQGGLSVNWLEEMVDKAVQKALAKNDKAEAQVAKADGAAAQVPPDAVMTTVTTTKIDTTKKPVQSAAAPAPVRTVVRNIVAPMPVDDGRVFDVGGFYKPADPLTDNIDDVLGNEDKQD
ncbi:MAG: hypothetical protein K2I17_00810 [Clostridia bacterium]|nr:hypothetical protein [Clostridia bacterium]